MAIEPVIRIQREAIDIAGILSEMEGDGSAGALVTFSGYCRNEGGALSALELEHYPGMSEREIGRIARQAAERWPLLGCLAIHRHGMVRPGEGIVFVACASEHREAAFNAAAFIMDFLKTDAPFWKREHLKDGSIGNWVESKSTDEAATDRWHRL